MLRNARLLGGVALGLLLGATACQQDELLRPPDLVPVDALFTRYVAIGNSITAGFQSLGLNDSVQAAAYPVLLARAMRTPFFVPYMSRPGCPGPLTNVFTQSRVGGGSAAFCALRKPEVPPSPFLSNLGIPGAETLEAFNYFDPSIVPSTTDAYRIFLLGGLTQVQAARRARPTFVTVWLGNNDAIGAIVSTGDAGNAALMTPPATFAQRYAALLDSLDAIGTIQGAVLIGAVQVAGAPYVSSGRAYAAAAAGIPTLTVLPNCLAAAEIPGPPANDSAFVLVPFHYGAPRVQAAAGGTPTTLDCSVPEVISAPEAVNMIVTVAQYNGAIQQEAAARGWAYVDPNVLLTTLAADTTAVRRFPAFSGPAAVTAPFGSALSLDGIHPSSSTHRLTAQALQQAINTAYGTGIPAIP